MTLLNFELLRTRLIDYVNYRIRNGEHSERSLARVIGVSQPQLHNVLKGCRTLSPDLADRLLRHFDINCLDLLDPSELHPIVEPQPERLEVLRKLPEPERRIRSDPKRRVS